MSYLSDLYRDKTWPALVKVHGVEVEYYRDGISLGRLIMVKGRQNVEMGIGEMTVSILADEWFAWRSELEGIGALRPKEHDRLIWTNSLGDTVINELRVIRNVTRQWTSIDTDGTIVQIFTVQVAS